MKDWAVLPLRISLGVVFIAHGLQKAFGLFSGPGIMGVTKMVEGMGFYPAVVWAYMLAYSELLGGIFLILGLLSRIGSALILIVMAVAILKVHGAHGLFMSNGGFEYPFIILFACISILISGPGKLSITKKL